MSSSSHLDPIIAHAQRVIDRLDDGGELAVRDALELILDPVSAVTVTEVARRIVRETNASTFQAFLLGFAMGADLPDDARARPDDDGRVIIIMGPG